MRYQIIYADPPWQWTKGTFINRGRARSVEKEYNTLSLHDICTLPVDEIATEDSVLFLWVTFPKLPQGLAVIDSWGFTYKTCGFVWVKQNQNSLGWFQGMGFYTRANAELCLLATKGKGLPRQSASVHQLIATPRMKHSRKPEEARHRIVALYGDVLRIELFARYRVDGWDCWGNEVGGDITFER